MKDRLRLENLSLWQKLISLSIFFLKFLVTCNILQMPVMLVQPIIFGNSENRMSDKIKKN